MDYTLKELLDLPQLRTLLDCWSAAQSIPCVILDLEGNVLAATSPPEAGGAPRRADLRARTDRDGRRQAPEAAAPAADPFIHRYPTGLVHAALPIGVAGQRLGTVCTDQIFLAAPDAIATIRQAPLRGCDEADYLSALREVPVIPEQMLRKNLDFVAVLVGALAEQGLRGLRESASAANVRENEGIFRSLFEKTNDPLLILNGGRFVDCNAAALRLLGYGAKPELLEHCPFEISPPLQPDGRSSQEKAEEMIATALRVGYHRFEWIHSKADGSELPVEVTLTPVTIGGELILHTLWRDITERKQAEESLCYSVALTNAALDSSADGILIVDREGKIVRWNQKYVELWRVPAELLDTSVKDRVLGYALSQLAQPEAFLARVMELYRHPEVSSHDLIELADGRRFERYSQPLRIGSEIVGRFWSFRDVTARQRAEEQAKDAMNYIQTILSSSPMGIETFKATGETVSANEAASRIIGASRDQLVRQNFRSIESWRRFGLLEVAERALASGLEQHGDFQVTTSFGERVDLNCLFVPFLFSGEQHLMLTIMDVTARRQAEAKLRYSLSLIDAVLESTPDAILVVDLDGKLARWNRKFIDLWRIPEEMIAGHVDDPVLGHVVSQMADPAEFLARVMDLYQHPEDSCEDLLVLADGRLIERYSQPLRIGAEIVGRYWSFRDSTERRRSEEEVRRQLELRVSERTQSLEEVNCELLAINCELEQRRNEAEETSKKMQQLSSAVENSSTSIVITDFLGQIEYVNPKFTEVTGYLPEEVIGRNPRLLKAAGQPPERYRELWETISSGREWSGDFCNQKKSGEIFWEHASISPIRSAQGHIINFVGVKEDITEQKRIAGELLAAQQAALAANRAKSEFLANMSHEIRTPLSAIIGFSDLTLRTALQPRQHEYLQKILTAGDLLLNIINDILDFSKIEARQLVMEQIPFRLDTILVNVTDIVRDKARQKGLELCVETAPEVALGLVGDQHRLSQVIVNLLSNAVKFTENGRVALRIALQQRAPGRVLLRFTVRDTGIGVTQEQARKLFQPFTQADGSTTRRFGGTGLGLSISKQLVELMGGEIWCESGMSQGSAFCFTAWFGAEEPGGSAQPVPPDAPRPDPLELTPDFSGSRVLLVEDNAVNMELASEILDATGAIVDAAENGREAVALVTGGGARYDLVLMDLQMPVLDGYQASRLIRSDGRFAGLPIIAMTAHAMTEVQQAILEAGMNAIITKPINARTFLRVMHAFLRAPETGAATPVPAGEPAGAGQPVPAHDGSEGSGSGGPAPAPATGDTPPAGFQSSLVSPILNRLLDYIKGRNGRAERYLDEFHLELAGLPESDLERIKAQLKNFDFAAARSAILALAGQNDILLSEEHRGEPS